MKSSRLFKGDVVFSVTEGLYSSHLVRHVVAKDFDELSSPDHSFVFLETGVPNRFSLVPVSDLYSSPLRAVRAVKEKRPDCNVSLDELEIQVIEANPLLPKSVF